MRSRSRCFHAWAVLAFLAVCGLSCRSERPAARPNIVVILVDTLRADRVSAYGYRRPTTPSIDALAARGALFEDASSTAAYTKAATASLLTGAYPSVHGAVSSGDAISPGVPTLAGALRAAGYTTAGFYLNRMVDGELGYGRGFDTYHYAGTAYLKSLGASPRGSDRPRSLLDDRAAVMAVENYLDGAPPSPFFLYLHLSGPHDPYSPPKESLRFATLPLSEEAEAFYHQPARRPKGEPTVLERIRRGLVPPDDRLRRECTDLYDDEVAFSDRQIGAILETLDRRGLLDNTIIAVTADHGEEFREHGDLGHGQSHFRELLHVPLVMAGPGVPRARLPDPVSLVDVMPTLLDLAGIDPPPSLPSTGVAGMLRHPGRSRPPRPVYAEGFMRVVSRSSSLMFRSLRVGYRKLVLDYRTKRILLFDLDTDPGETTNLVEREPEEARLLLDRLTAIHDENRRIAAGYPPGDREISPELQEKIRSLGYLSGGGGESGDRAFLLPVSAADFDPLLIAGDLKGNGPAFDIAELEDAGFNDVEFLYGWRKSRRGGVYLMREAGLRLRSPGGTVRWLIRGSIPGFLEEIPQTLTLHLPEGEESEHPLPRRGRFVIRGSFDAGSDRTPRLDLTCRFDGPRAAGIRRDAYGPCAVVTGLEVVSSVAAAKPAIQPAALN